MTKTRSFDRPAATAIAAVLALFSTPALAQEASGAPSDTSLPLGPPAEAPPIAPDLPSAMPGAEPDPVGMPPVAAAPAAETPLPASEPVFAPRNEVVQQALPTEADNAASASAVAAGSANVAARDQAPRTPRPVASGPGANRVPEPAPDRAAVVPAAPANDRFAASSRAETQSAPSTASSGGALDAQARDATYWALGAGAGLLLLGVGVYAFSGAPRRPRSRPIRPATIVSRQPARPATAPEFRPANWTQSPALVTTQLSPVDQAANLASRDTVLAAMVAAPPSADNPFLTRKNRIRRARFLIAHGRADIAREPERLVPERAAEAASLREPAMAASPPAQSTARRPQPASSFGAGIRMRPSGWKPASA
jgi:hypothetical protein